ncbi:MAG: peptidylprolyl isomerase [Candidatus Aenigmatarchaeota archaeon]
MKEGDFVRINYIGRIKESGLIFDLTDEEVAKKEDVYNPHLKYGPIPVIIGSNFLIKGLEDALKDMKVGEKRHISLKPKEAFGERSEKLVKTIPESEFTKQNMVPYQGMVVNINNLRGRVMSVSGGRVKIDFNHPLAGKEVEYDIEIKEEIKNEKDKIFSILEFFYNPIGGEKVEIKGEEVDIFINPENELPRQIKIEISNLVSKWIGLKKIRFIEEYSPNITQNIEIEKSQDSIN